MFITTIFLILEYYNCIKYIWKLYVSPPKPSSSNIKFEFPQTRGILFYNKNKPSTILLPESFNSFHYILPFFQNYPLPSPPYSQTKPKSMGIRTIFFFLKGSWLLDVTRYLHLKLALMATMSNLSINNYYITDRAAQQWERPEAIFERGVWNEWP